MRVNTLTAPLLNFWAAKAAGTRIRIEGNQPSVDDPEAGHAVPFQPGIDWSQAFPIIADDWFDVETVLIDWFGPNWPHTREIRENALTWFVRAFVAVKFGDEVENNPLTTPVD
jgi:hypothetical protein